MHKVIEKIETYKANEIEKAIQKAKQGYEDAKDFYNDTGYDRYFNKMEKCEQELLELEEYICKDKVRIKDIDSEQYKEYLKMKQDLKKLKNKLFYLVADLGLPATADLISIQDILRDY